MKLTYFILPLLILISCELTDGTDTEEVEDVITMVLDPRLDQDVNGYYHLELNQSTFQTTHRLSGHVYMNDEPLELLKVYWESSHYWLLNDTLGYFIHRGLTDDLEYVSYDTTYITGFNDFVVPTINCCPTLSNIETILS